MFSVNKLLVSNRILNKIKKEEIVFPSNLLTNESTTCKQNKIYYCRQFAEGILMDGWTLSLTSARPEHRVGDSVGVFGIAIETGTDK